MINRSRRVLVFGSFDPLHKGHVNFFEQAREYGDALIVVVARNSAIKWQKGRRAYLDEKKRLDLVSEVEWVDEAVLGDEWPVDNPFNLLEIMNFEAIALGYDQDPDISKVRRELKKIGRERVEVVRMKPYRPALYKSSYLRKQGLEK